MATEDPARSEKAEQVSTPNTSNPALPEERANGGLGPVTPGSVLSFLWNRIPHGQMDEVELTFLSRASECASHMGSALADTVSNVGCLITWDDQPGKISAGNFTYGESVSSLMFVIADQIRVISELTQIADDAAFTLRYRRDGHV